MEAARADEQRKAKEEIEAVKRECNGRLQGEKSKAYEEGRNAGKGQSDAQP